MIDWDFVGELLTFVVTAIISFIVVVPLFLLLVVGAFSLIGVGDLHSTWPDSAEFSQLATGQERFSEHATNVGGLTVVVDHQTGAQYLYGDDGVCPLLSADGAPLLVAEVGE